MQLVFMNFMKNPMLFRTLGILAIIVLTVLILIYGKPFLVPLTIAALLSMLLLPITQWFQRKRFGKALSTLLSISLLLMFLSGVLFFVGWQLSGILEDSNKLKEVVSEKYEDTKEFIAEKLGITEQKQEKMIAEQQNSSTAKMSSTITDVMAGISGFLTDTMLVFVYIFLFIYQRSRIKGFIIRLLSVKERPHAIEILDQTQKVTVKYLSGLFLMIVCLWVMYGIGFSLLGVKNAIFFAVLCGLLEIVPFVGNLTGTALTVVMALIQGGDLNMVIGILVVYGLVQFIQTYLLEPIIVGAEVSINPMFTIIGLVAGEMIWGIGGMILAIPLLGITKIVFDHIEPLKPFGYLIGSEKKIGEQSLLKTVKGWFNKSAVS
jgi:predicted PurR-regulated permease PerM